MSWVDVGRVIDLPLAWNGVLVGVHDGAIWAIEDRCTHAGCAFSTDGAIEDRVAICDCHGSEFDVFTGGVLAPPADEPVATYRARISGERAEVDL